MSRLVILSDVHGNYDALQAVVADAEHRGVDDFIFLGDAVGYGPEPHRCLELLSKIVASSAWVRGNHDDAMGCFANAGQEAAEDLGAELETSLALHIGSRPATLDAAQINFGLLQTRPRLIQHLLRRDRELLFDDELLLVHGGRRHDTPGITYTGFRLGAGDELDHAQQQHPHVRMVLVGHTHTPACFVRRVNGSCARVVPDKDGRLDLRDGIFLLNPGSVGQPRDGDPRASYMSLDRQNEIAELHRVAYDISNTIRKMEGLGLAQTLHERLVDGR